MTDAPPDKATGLLAKVGAFLRGNGLTILFELLVNFILPYVIYSYAVAPLGEVRALLASSAPPILWSVVEFARHRRVDALSMLVLGGIVLSLLAMLGGGGVQFLQLREKMVTGLIGLIFLGSALIRRPLIYQLARATMMRRSQEEADEFAGLQIHAGFRQTMTVMTLVWGAGLLADFVLGVVLVMTISVHDYLIVNPILGYATMGSLSLWTYWYGQRQRRRGEARRAAAEAAAAAADAQPE